MSPRGKGSAGSGTIGETEMVGTMMSPDGLLCVKLRISGVGSTAGLPGILDD